MANYGRIQVDPAVLLGKPVIRGTRVPVDLLLRRLAEGATEEDLLAAYPHLERDDIRAALAFAADELSLTENLEPPTIRALAEPTVKGGSPARIDLDACRIWWQK